METQGQHRSDLALSVDAVRFLFNFGVPPILKHGGLRLFVI